MNDKKIRVTLVVDNHTDNGFMPEHGLAMWIEADGQKVLFDTGQGLALEHNAAALGIDLGQTDALILSHGHYDHTGGVDIVLQRAPHAAVYCHSEVVKPRYAVRNGNATAIHMPRSSMAALDKRPRHLLNWAPHPVMISDSMGLTGPVPRITGYEDVGGPFYLDSQGRRPDLLMDDMALWINTSKGIVVCVGCCHSGLVNTLEYVKKLNKNPRISAVIGGFHLVNATDERLSKTIDALKRLAPDSLIACHCTGDIAMEKLAMEPALCVEKGWTGRILEFEI